MIRKFILRDFGRYFLHGLDTPHEDSNHNALITPRVKNLRLRIARVRDWEDFSKTLEHSLKPITTLSALFLESFPGEGERSTITASWSRDPGSQNDYSLLRSDRCLVFDDQPSDSGLIRLCSSHYGPNGEAFLAVCIPIGISEGLKGALHMIFPPKTRLSLSGWTLIEQTGLEISLVAERLLLQDTISKLRCDRDMVQKHFNRYLHDTVAHDMAYLQIRLEELKVRPPYLEEKVFHSKINELISVVNQTYNQVRAYLSGLKHNQADDLLTGIREYSQTIARRGNLRVHLEIRGEAIELPLETQQTILLFIREALRNIEKHAGAREAHLRFNWAVNTIEIQIQDDGQGFDYRRKEENPGHIGIQILEDCANELNAQLDIWSEERLGTRISLIIPILKDNSELVE